MTKTLFFMAFLANIAAQEGSFVQKVDYRLGVYTASNASKGQLLTLWVRGLGVEEIARADNYPTVELAGVTATIQHGLEEPTSLHIAEVGVRIPCGSSQPVLCDLTAVTVVIPITYTPVPYPFPTSQRFPRIVFSKNGTPGYSSTFGWASAIHIFQACDIIFSSAPLPRNLGCLPLIARPDGSLATANNPARPGETVTVYGTGFGLPADFFSAAFWTDLPQNRGDLFPIAPKPGPLAGFFSFQLKLPDGPPPNDRGYERWGVQLFNGGSPTFVIPTSEAEPAEPVRIDVNEILSSLKSLRPVE